MTRARLAALVGAIVALFAVVAVVMLFVDRSEHDAITRQERVAELLDRAASGTISGAQSLDLARRLQTDAFAQPAAPSGPAMQKQASTPAKMTDAERAAIAQAPRVSRRDMMAIARASFEDAAATLLQEPDDRIRTAVVQLRAAETQAAGLDALSTIAAEGGAASAPIWRASGALMLALGDERAATALENARARNPQDKGMWRLSSFAYAQQDRVRDAASAALLGEGIEAASVSDWRMATVRLEQALLLVSDPQTRGFVLGQLGDAAAATENWENAENRYRAALDIHGVTKDIAALSLDSSKLARALIKRGDARGACQTLRRARAQGAVVTDAELRQACDASPTRAP